jgi:ribonucleoside-diphosphate reductase alpha chain
MEVSGESDEAKSPYINSTAASISWKKRIELQAVVQKYTTHSISSTINLPADASEELIGNIYMEAWKSGLKGITVYRDGSRTGVLLAESEEKNADQQIPDRPQQLEAEVIRFRNQDEKWIAVIGLMNNKPYEIFTGKDDASFRIPGTVHKGWIVRKNDPVKRYDFQYEENGKRINVEGLSRSFNAEFWNYAKLISGVLRYGMPLTQVIGLIAGLHLVPDSINTWKSGVERALRKFIPDGTLSGRICPECNSPQGLIYEESCVKCRDCGYSECG